MRKLDHKNYRLVHHILTEYREQEENNVFSDNVQEFNNSMKAVDEVCLITAHSIYFFTKQFAFIKRFELHRVEQVVLIKTNQSVFSLTITGQKPVLVQSLKRTELIVFLLTQRENMGKATQICRTANLNVIMNSGREQSIRFEKQALGQKFDTKNKTLLKNLQLNNFANSLQCGYLEK